MEPVQKALDIGLQYMRKDQLDIINESMSRLVFGLSLPMGHGKTYTSLIRALMVKIRDADLEPILVTASKSLLGSWETEIKKFFGQSLKYQIMNVDTKNFVLYPDTVIVLVTPDTAARYYRDNNIHEKFVYEEKYMEPGSRFTHVKKVYDSPKNPYLRTATGGSVLYQKKWASLIIDEGHEYTNILTARCKALGSICSKNRWMLSGTLFNEPDNERILGYHVILHWPGFPKDLPDAKKYIESRLFKGTNKTIIIREKLELDIKVNKHIISHDLLSGEGQIYTCMRQVLVILRTYCKNSKNSEERKKFSSYILAMITFLRQCVVVPVLPIANIALEMTKLTDSRSQLTVLLTDQFNKLNLKNFLETEDSVKSSRIQKVIETLSKYTAGPFQGSLAPEGPSGVAGPRKIILFSCFCTSLDILCYYISKELPGLKIFRLLSTMSHKARTKLITSFQESKSTSILVGTYELMGNGLNLQEANVILILDFWWNQAKTSQAIARIVRPGQKSKEVDVYFYTSNTGIERSLFAKQQDKNILLEEIKTGPVKHTVKTLKMEEILKLIDSNENYDYLVSNY